MGENLRNMYATCSFIFLNKYFIAPFLIYGTYVYLFVLFSSWLFERNSGFNLKIITSCTLLWIVFNSEFLIKTIRYLLKLVLEKEKIGKRVLSRFLWLSSFQHPASKMNIARELESRVYVLYIAPKAKTLDRRPCTRRSQEAVVIFLFGLKALLTRDSRVLSYAASSSPKL